MPSARTTLTALLGVAISCAGGCAIGSYKAYPMKNENIMQGAYECSSPTKTYSFNSQDPTSNFLWETDTPGIKFKDADTKKTVQLYSGLDDYNCKPASKTDSNNKNWVAVHIWDSFYPLNFEGTFPETIISIETIFYQFYKYNAIRYIENTLGIDENPLYGYREREGHVASWLHLSDEFVQRYNSKLKNIDKELFLFSNQETDVFVGWEGNFNANDFLEKGLTGLTNKAYKFDGTIEGNFHGFKESVKTGDPEFEGGFFITDEQALKFLESIETYRGLQDGYTFLTKIEDKPNPQFEPEMAQAVTGNHCIDYTVYGLTTAGIAPTGTFEKLKVPLYYPEEFWDKPLPINLSEVFLGGLFDKEEIINDIYNTKKRYRAVNNWNYETLINWLEKNKDFPSKRIVEDLLPAVSLGMKITTPYPFGEDRYRFRKTTKYLEYLRMGNEMVRSKLEKSGLVGENLQKLIKREETLKQDFKKSNESRD